MSCPDFEFRGTYRCNGDGLRCVASRPGRRTAIAAWHLAGKFGEFCARDGSKSDGSAGALLLTPARVAELAGSFKSDENGLKFLGGTTCADIAAVLRSAFSLATAEAIQRGGGRRPVVREEHITGAARLLRLK